MKTPALFLLSIGCIWGIFSVWALLTIAGIADLPKSIIQVLLYWVPMFVGPLTLIVGSILVLRGIDYKIGLAFIIIGCLVYSILTIYNSIVGMQTKPLQVTPPYWFYIVWLISMILADIAAYKIYRAIQTLH